MIFCSLRAYPDRLLDRGGKMIQCKDCEFFETGPQGQKTFKCNPFADIKEPDCLEKWQLIRLDMLLASYQAMLQFQNKMAPLQDKILKYMQKEIEDLDESDKWKVDEEQDETDEPENSDEPNSENY